jgi:hypothetical protein
MRKTPRHLRDLASWRRIALSRGGGAATLRARLLLTLVMAALAAGLVLAGPAAALPANPWTGRWLSGSDVITLTQTGAQITGTGPCPGTTGAGVTYSATASADSTSANFSYTSAVCTGVGGTFTANMRADGLKVTGSGVTQFGTGFSFEWNYQGGGTEPRTPPPPPPPSAAPAPTPPLPVLPAVLCPTSASPWTGEWQVTATIGGRPSAGSTVRLLQTGSNVAGQLVGGESSQRVTGTVSSKPGVLSHLDGELADGGPSQLSLDLVDARTYRGTQQPPGGAPFPVEGKLQGCADVGRQALPPAPNLQNTIPSPQRVAAGPTSATFPGKLSLRSLKKSKCVRVVVVSKWPARVLATIFSGRRSIRLFGQKEVSFPLPGRRVVCIPVPRRAHTFNVRTPLRFALGYRLGTAPPRQLSGSRRPRAPRPVIRPIRLVP